MGSWTPGPWRWHWRNDENAPGSICAGHENRPHAIAMCPKYARQDWPYNAPLLSAAPELYEALEEAIKELEAYEEECGGEQYNNPRFNAVLAKAKGEPHY